MEGYDKLMHMKFNFCAAAVFLFLVLSARAQTTTFTYQGRLISSNAPATGAFDLRFQIYNDNGNSNVVAGPLTNAPVGVTNGLFTVPLDFGASVFDGSTRWLEIGVRGFNASTNVNTNAYVVLSPRQMLTSVPYAIQSLNASSAAVLTGPLPATSITGTIPNSLLSSNVAILTNNVIFSGSVTAANFIGNGFGLSNVPGTSLIGIITGNGSGLSNVPATSLTGTLPDARLSANVALQSNPSLNFAGTVSATNFSGGGHGLTNVPGAFFWVTVAANTQAQPNIGYICNNGLVPVTITLPSSPSVGDVYKVAGVGAGGWIIKQNANQMIAAGNLPDSIGQSWTARGITANWSAVASSADGTKLVATVKGGQIYTSTDSGVTWTPQANSTNWSSVASSADGTYLVAGVGNNVSLVGYIYTSGNSGIGSWTPHDNARQWVSVASSADGAKLVAAVYSTIGSGNPGIYTSTSSGASWGQSKAVPFCSAVASSADGAKLVATVYGGQIWTSTDSGNSWLARDSSRNWTAVASSADGSRLLAAVSGGSLYISYNSGTNWAGINPGASLWTAVASSADGSRLVAVASSGQVYISTDSGVTWAQRFGLPSVSWTGAACSADGSRLVLAAYGDKIYTSSQSSTTTGPTGYLFGPQHSAIELIYAGNNLFLPLSHEGTIRAY
jgi:hypothetical protein